MAKLTARQRAILDCFQISMAQAQILITLGGPRRIGPKGGMAAVALERRGLVTPYEAPAYRRTLTDDGRNMLAHLRRLGL